jgi:hypothetical protein
MLAPDYLIDKVIVMIPGCAKSYTKSFLDHRYVAREINISEVELSDNLHAIKRAARMRGRNVWICLDQGNVYDPISLEYLGNVRDGY